jgi:hypothetical protein
MTTTRRAKPGRKAEGGTAFRPSALLELSRETVDVVHSFMVN